MVFGYWFLVIGRASPVVAGISNKYFPFPEMFSFQFFTSIIFVACILSSSQMALKGLQKREWIESVLFLLNIKRRGGEFFLNIRPVVFWRIVVRSFAFMENFLFFM